MPRYYTADADTYCAACAESRYGPETVNRQDHEGNEVRPVWPWEDDDATVTCGDCLLVLHEPELVA